jgi:hypothetical protein
MDNKWNVFPRKKYLLVQSAPVFFISAAVIKDFVTYTLHMKRVDECSAGLRTVIYLLDGRCPPENIQLIS